LLTFRSNKIAMMRIVEVKIGQSLLVLWEVVVL